jgi:electron transfer flavoprotein beta subunit
MGAKKKPQDTLTLADLGLAPEEVGEAGSRTEVYALGAPPPRGESQKIEDHGGDSAETIVEYLAAKKLL